MEVSKSLSEEGFNQNTVKNLRIEHLSNELERAYGRFGNQLWKHAERKQTRVFFLTQTWGDLKAKTDLHWHLKSGRDTSVTR